MNWKELSVTVILVSLLIVGSTLLVDYINRNDSFDRINESAKRSVQCRNMGGKAILVVNGFGDWVIKECVQP